MHPQGPSRTGPLPPRFKEVLQGCRQMVHSHLAPLFVTMLENADVALLEFASKAESNAAQGKFFEAMQELKRKRADAERIFFKSVDNGFRDFINGTSPGSAPVTEPSALATHKLSLVEKHEVEAALPVQNMVAKASATYSEQLYGLNQRLAVVNGGSRLTEAELPGGPTQLAEAARTAFNLFDMDAKTRVVVYAVFERYLMRELRGMYDEYNRRLVNAGVLPNLRYEIRKAHDPRQIKPAPVPTGSGAAATPQQTVGEEAFQSILELLARSHGAAPVSAAPGEVASLAGGTVAAAVAAGTRTTILGTIDRIQLEQSGAEANERFQQDVIENIGVDQDLLERLKSALVDERQRLYGGVDRRRVASADADIIDLVGMLFDYMLQDDQLPNVVKALLSRLHTPFLKVAIVDPQLFTEKHHPGRRLLDVMAAAGARWVTEDDLERGIFPCMRSVVERILRDFKDDLRLLDELLDDFTAHLRDVEQKSQVIERRTIEAADGQARLQNAREKATQALATLLCDARLAAEPEAFLRQVWLEKLTFILLREREEEDSSAWKLADKLAQMLVWSFTAKRDAAERDQLHEALPTIRAELRDGLEQLQGYGRRDNDKMFAQICVWQDQALTAPLAAELLPPQERETPAASPAENPSPGLDAASASPALEAALERLRQIGFDTWFEFGAPGGHRQRLKLAWYSKISSNYMFVDAMGVKAAEHTHRSLAEMLCTGEARVLDLQSKPFLDRALQTILTWLGRDKTETPA